MTKEELEKATGQELIEQRDYCGVDGYYGDCLNDVNAEMLKRFNRLVDLEKENAELKAVLYCSRETCDNCGFIDCENFQRQRKSVPCSQYISYKDRLKRLDKEFNVIANEYGKAESKLTKAKDLLNEFMRISKAIDEDFDHDYSELIGETETFLKEVEK